MAILSGPEIVRLVKRTKYRRSVGEAPLLPAIDIEPFDPENAGPNSYDLALAPTLLTYNQPLQLDPIMMIGMSREAVEEYRMPLDAKKPNPTISHTIGPEGFVLMPGTLYLGATVEKTASLGIVPWLEGRSSIGRLGVCIHATAGFGDDGFGWNDEGGCTWTLEISVVEPVRIYAGMRVCQIIFCNIEGERSPYKGKYAKQILPEASHSHEDHENLPR